MQGLLYTLLWFWPCSNALLRPFAHLWRHVGGPGCPAFQAATPSQFNGQWVFFLGLSGKLFTNGLLRYSEGILWSSYVSDRLGMPIMPHSTDRLLWDQISKQPTTCAASTPTAEEVWSCKRDEGRSLGAGDQAQAPNHCELLALRALVVSVAGKGGSKTCQVRSGETSASEPLMTCRNL